VGVPLALELFLLDAGEGARAPPGLTITTAWAIRAVPDEEEEEEEEERRDEEEEGEGKGGEQSAASSTDPAVAVAGVLAGVVLGPPSTLRAVFLRPGLFRVGARGAVAGGGGGAGQRVGVEALYVRAE
jgi:hypothetical protein